MGRTADGEPVAPPAAGPGDAQRAGGVGGHRFGRRHPMARGVLVGGALVLLVGWLAGCGGGTPHLGGARPPPDLAAFLRLPVATPTSCPATVGGSAFGRRSPWVGHVDISVFLSDRASPGTVRGVGARLRALPHVRTVYFESRRQAYAEFQRLYTCSATVPPSQVPASYRLVLETVTRPQRDAVVHAALRLPGVADASCDPSNPCTNIRRE